MKKWMWVSLIAVAVLIGVGFAGYNYALNLAAEKLSQELSSNEELLKEIEDLAVLTPVPVQDGDTMPETITENDAEVDTTQVGESEEPVLDQTKQENKVQFENKQEAVKFTMSRFSASEIAKLSKMNASDLTPEEKKELKSLAFSKFSPAEIEAVRQAVTQ
ncbi:hypothetical protein BEP19_12920 [Ammoniphilus oxalaticus]|uniref:Uncharacterized protein n=1 Tax=Ammoniphilus oxalaticus TaxID=66863 RepID=A0A419SH60_9BACL|nr:hypothetical protein [Ammoniphilus oxalaticus]RKD23118.1 hypothetical protein BEP19_12920 [Ammoniphilus oxalaticus]